VSKLGVFLASEISQPVLKLESLSWCQNIQQWDLYNLTKSDFLLFLACKVGQDSSSGFWKTTCIFTNFHKYVIKVNLPQYIDVRFYMFYLKKLT